MKTKTIGTATLSKAPGTAAPPDLRTDGPVFTGTMARLVADATHPGLPPDAAARVQGQTFEFLSRLVSVYESGVATGEVGLAGSGVVAGPAVKSATGCPTGLLYGRVQSGKTVAMIAATAAALDNGFRVVVVLTSDNLKLVEQTAERFRDLDGPLVHDSTSISQLTADREHVARSIAKSGLVVISAKNSKHLSTLVDLLSALGADRFPAVIFDDEADQATLDTNTAKRSKGGKAKVPPSVINKKTVENPDDEGASLREKLVHHVFVQVTATPYALLLQNSTHPLRPKFTYLLEPGPNYTGGDAFFSQAILESKGPPLVMVHELEATSTPEGEVPEGLEKAIAFFLVSAVARIASDPAASKESQNFLCHTSQMTDEHDVFADLIRESLKRMMTAVEQRKVASPEIARLTAAYEELGKTVPNLPAFDFILDEIDRRLPRRRLVIINALGGSIDSGRDLTFIVGGNILGRGLTIDNLLVTYYLRNARVSQMDTVHQHARMFGYRRKSMPFTRVFLPRSLAFRFHNIHESEQRLRKTLESSDPLSAISVQTVGNLRATRPNVLDTRSIQGITPGHQIYPYSLKAMDPALSQRIEGELRGHLGTLKHGATCVVSIEDLVRLIRLVPFAESVAGDWSPKVLCDLLLDSSANWKSQGHLTYLDLSRGLRTRDEMSATGATSGDLLTAVRSRKLPSLLLFRETGKHLPVFAGSWLPTLVFPDSMPSLVYNAS